ncbi:hypothetical protein JIN84_17930 [Luteolibacter yonseiensis]|uniref:SWIM-type domain-containing protein n=1 Tax=Luteolibacter yonseiensis TaxID=1144680 RepID=A0A934VCU6_9BACT|nr:hypothetical protein [Luteolibacter yonseiensis]MBK1817505.1 hypothetical protein [Luteolibacter yonseiensis]
MAAETASKRAKVNDRWTEYDPPWVEPDGSAPFRYRVESKSMPDLWYLVDLTARNGHGRCSCIHFQTVADPNYRRHGSWIPYAPKRQGVSECKHLRAAWDYHHLHVTVPMMDRFKNGIPAA